MQKYKTYEEITSKLLSIGLLVPSNEEHVFCTKSRMFFKRFETGATLIGAYGKSSDYKSSRVDLTIQSGSANDLKTKLGAHHFLEHLLFERSLRDKFISNDINSNASTSSTKIQFYIEGVNNPKYKNFGINAILDDCIFALTNPIAMNHAEHFSYEREVILKEIDQRDSDFYRQCDLKLDSLLFEDTSYLRSNTLGTYETLNSIKPKDLEALVKKYFLPSNMYIAVGGEGNGSDILKLYERLNKYFSEFNRLGTSTFKKNIPNPKIKNFKDFEYLEVKNETIKNGMCAVGFISLVNTEIYSKEEYALNAICAYLDKIYFERIRDKGLVYSGYIDKYGFLTGDNIIYTVGFVSNKNAKKVMEAMKAEYEEMLKELLNKKTLHRFYTEFKTSLQAYPISYVQKIRDFYTYFPNHKLLPNSKRIRELRTDFDVKLLDEFADKLLRAKKVLYKIGDF